MTVSNLLQRLNILDIDICTADQVENLLINGLIEFVFGIQPIETAIVANCLKREDFDRSNQSECQSPFKACCMIKVLTFS